MIDNFNNWINEKKWYSIGALNKKSIADRELAVETIRSFPEFTITYNERGFYREDNKIALCKVNFRQKDFVAEWYYRTIVTKEFGKIELTWVLSCGSQGDIDIQPDKLKAFLENALETSEPIVKTRNFFKALGYENLTFLLRGIEKDSCTWICGIENLEKIKHSGKLKTDTVTSTDKVIILTKKTDSTVSYPSLEQHEQLEFKTDKYFLELCEIGEVHLTGAVKNYIEQHKDEPLGSCIEKIPHLNRGMILTKKLGL